MSEWISCSERMPKDHKQVLVYLTEENKVETAEKVPAGWYFKSGLIIHESKASHWMPLPEPPVIERAEQPAMPAIIPDGTDITILPRQGVYTAKTAAEQYMDFFKGRSKDELFAAIRDVEEDDGI